VDGVAHVVGEFVGGLVEGSDAVEEDEAVDL